MGGWKAAAMVERYAHVAPDNLAQSAARLENIGVGYDLATVNLVKGEKLSYKIARKPYNWCPEPGSNRHAGFTQATDFKSVVSTNFTTRAGVLEVRPRVELG